MKRGNHSAYLKHQSPQDYDMMNLTTDYNLEEPLVVTNEREMEWKEEGTHPLLLRVYDVNKESKYSEQCRLGGWKVDNGQMETGRNGRLYE